VVARTGDLSERGALTRVAALQCSVGRHRHGGGCSGDGNGGGGTMEEEQGVVGCGGGGGGCRGRGCRATCDAVTSANRPFPLYCSFLIPSNPLPFSPLRPPSFFRAAHEPHPRNRTRPPNYGLEFELAVNPFIALPPPPAWQSLPDWLTAVSLPLSHLRLATLERRV